jgi:hypothetical protein
MRAITYLDRAADKAIVDAIKALILAYGQTKLAGDVGGALDWARAERIIVRRALAKNRKGATGFAGDTAASLPQA